METARTAITVGGAAAAGRHDWCNHWSCSRQSTSWLCYWRGSRCYCRWLSELLRRPLWWRQPSAYAPAASPAAPVVPGDHGGSDGLIPDEVLAGAPEIVGDQHPANTPPMQSNGNTLRYSPQATPTATPKVTLQQLWQIAKCTGISDEALLEIYQGLGVKYRDAAFRSPASVFTSWVL